MAHSYTTVQNTAVSQQDVKDSDIWLACQRASKNSAVVLALREIAVLGLTLQRGEALVIFGAPALDIPAGDAMVLQG